METRYFSDELQPDGLHKLALHASKEVFDRIKGHRERKARIQAQIAHTTQYKQYLHDGNKAMTDTWENSVENLRKKKEENRLQKLAQKVDDRVERYYKVLKLQADEREKYVEEVNHKKFMTTGEQKNVNSAILTSDCLYENTKLIELKERNHKVIDADWKAYEQKIIEEDEAFKKDELIKQCVRKKNAEDHKNCLLKQIEEKKAKAEEEKRIQLENENIDIARQVEEMKIIEKNKHEDFLKSKEYWRKTLKKSRDIKMKQKQADEKQDAELNVVAQIFQDTKSKIECRKKKIKQEEIQKTLEKQEEACKVLTDIYTKKEEKEAQIISKAITEVEAEEELKLQKKKEHELKLVEERKKHYEDVISKKNKKREEELEFSRWDMLNRMKFIETVGIEDKDMEQKRRNKKILHYNELKEQMEDEKQRQLKKQAEEDSFKWHNYPEVDEKYLNYANEMLSKQREDGKPTYSIEYTIMDYKKRNGIIPPNLKHLQCLAKKEDEKKKKLALETRRICPVKNDSSEIKECFCPSKK